MDHAPASTPAHGDLRGLKIPVGTQHYRAFVGPPVHYDVTAGSQFSLLFYLGLREHHSLLDIGCGSLRGGKLFIPYLLPDRYAGVEPEAWLVRDGIDHELGEAIIELKRPAFIYSAEFPLSALGRSFDFVLAQSVFSHAAPAQIRRCLAEVKRVMKPGGMFAATFMLGRRDYEGDEWVYPGCVTYTQRGMRRMLAEAGLRGTLISWPHRMKQTWMVITHAEHRPSFGELPRFSWRQRARQWRVRFLARWPHLRAAYLGLRPGARRQ